MALRVRSHSNFMKQATVFDGNNAGPPKLRAWGRCLHRSVDEDINDVHLKTRGGYINVGILS